MSGPARTGATPSPGAGGAEALEHPALGEASDAVFARLLAEAACSDRAKLGVVLQGASLLSLCETAGWSLASGWSGARIEPGGALRGVQAKPGRDRFPVQSRLLELLLALFRSQGRVAGRGEARRAARALSEMWSTALVPMSGDDAIGIGPIPDDITQVPHPVEGAGVREDRIERDKVAMDVRQDRDAHRGRG